MGLPFIPPELRENWGEIEAAEEGRLPDLVDLGDIKGDLQMHTTATDGDNSIEEMAAFARKLGYKYIAITDHSKAVRVAGGLNDEETRRPRQARSRRPTPRSQESRSWRASRSTSSPTGVWTWPTRRLPCATWSLPPYTPGSTCPRTR